MNPFEVLQISPAASQDEAREAYHALAKNWHPDKFSGPEKNAAEERFREITEAYAKIKNGSVALPDVAPSPVVAAPPAPATKSPKDWLLEAQGGFAQKNYELAISLSQFCFQFPEVAEQARLLYATALEETGRDIKSRTRAYEEVARINPNNVRAVAKLAELYSVLNMPARAASMAKKAKALGVSAPRKAPPPDKPGAGGIVGKFAGFFKRG
ncbi:MAG: DnaJ domain-containing protein [Holophagales bacterium]|jgi:tetratricopeptide (TPR) repeat protein|nr:DnaJ domain-containing protein [Holophagales bacterium]